MPAGESLKFIEVWGSGLLKIDENLHLIECPWGDVGVTVVLLKGRENLLIDTGPLDAPEKNIFPYLRSIGSPKTRLAALLHGHVDHAGGCCVIKKLTGSKLLAHRDAYKIIGDQTFGFQRLFTPYMPYLDQRVAQDFAEMYRRCWNRTCRIDAPLKEGDVIDLGAGELEVIETPGHEEGSISLYDRDSKTLFTGDAVQGLGVNSKKEPVIPLYRDLNAYVASLKRILTLKICRLVASHPFKPQSSSMVAGEQAVELIRSSIKATEQVDEAIMLILEDSKEGIDLGRIGEEVQKKLVGGPLTAVALWTIDAHVTSMLERGEVRVTEKDCKKIVNLT